MLSLYVNHCGWVAKRNDGRNVYTSTNGLARVYGDEHDKEFLAAREEGWRGGHNVDVVRRSDEYAVTMWEEYEKERRKRK